MRLIDEAREEFREAWEDFVAHLRALFGPELRWWVIGYLAALATAICVVVL